MHFSYVVCSSNIIKEFENTRWDLICLRTRRRKYEKLLKLEEIYEQWRQLEMRRPLWEKQTDGGQSALKIVLEHSDDQNNRPNVFGNWVRDIEKNFCSSSAFCLSALKMRVDAIKEGNRLTIKGDASIGLSTRIFSNTRIFAKVRFASISYSKFHFNLNINKFILGKFN